MTTIDSSMPVGLGDALDMAIGLEILRMRDWTPAQRIAVARQAREWMGTCDELQFGGRHCAKTFGAVARAVAAMAYQMGGCDFGGRHWCTSHDACKAADAANAARRAELVAAGKDPYFSDLDDPPPPSRPIVDIQLPPMEET